MIISLAGDSFSAVSAAMHLESSPQISQMEDDHSSLHDQNAMAETDHHGDQGDHGSQEKTRNSWLQGLLRRRRDHVFRLIVEPAACGFHPRVR
ncbi:hypothetical protein [Neorhizobium galegae]|uniref:hypothetical protein n=1 Tax=Neorhizobium galegae TaxID=399 RepID=UPI000627829C|nr:hypothetical protein [Neorhizobium galegae]MCM2496695.1 hypothetical protein [Neorhizobium galegae]MCQ1774875.1 hypothetical protein [Neorhizobium galegae]MCQ1779447.1 hypothetical protein [Neorhizobium galegae]MCQ1795607.1 hypothetical protein [Neorhizobium galegae]